MPGKGNEHQGGDAHHEQRDNQYDHGHEGDNKGSRHLGVDLADAHTSDQIRDTIKKDDPKLAEYIHKHFGDVEFSQDGNGDIELHDGKHGGHVPHGWEKMHVDHGRHRGHDGGDDDDVVFENGTRFKHDGEMDFKDGTILQVNEDGSVRAIKLEHGDHLDSKGDLISGDGKELMPGNPFEAAKQEALDQQSGLSTGSDTSGTGTASSDATSAATSTAVTTADAAVTEAVSDVSSGLVDTSTKVGIDSARAALDQAIAAYKPGQAPANLVMARMSLDSAEGNIQPQLQTYEEGSSRGLNIEQIASVEKHQWGKTRDQIRDMLAGDGADSGAAA